MKIKAYKRLNEKTSGDIRKIEAASRQTDNTEVAAYLKTDLNYKSGIKTYYICYDSEKAVAFIALFLPTPGEAEVNAVTMPEYRRQGCFGLLLKACLAEMQEQEIKRLVFVHEPLSTAAAAVLKKIKAKKAYSEYLMKYTGCSTKASGAVEIKTAGINDFDTFARLNAQFFHLSAAGGRSWAENILRDSDISAYKAEVNGEVVGICCVNNGISEASIFGLGIDKIYRGKGYGREMLLGLTEILKPQQKRIILQVGSKNHTAFEMYKKYGFTVSAQQDYYTYNCKY